MDREVLFLNEGDKNVTMFHVKHLRWNIGGFITEQK